jgi:putative endonuclease
MPSWNVYLVRCADGTLYTGIATDVARRVAEHNGSDALGARYTRSRRPVVLVYAETVATRSEALKREHQIRRLGRAGKEKLMGEQARRS